MKKGQGEIMFQKMRTAAIGALILSVVWLCPAAARQITDMAGRRVEVPDTVNSVYGTSPPATYMVYALDAGLVAGLNTPLNPTEKAYIDPRLHRLPVIGGWFGQGRVANLECLLKLHPDVIVAWIREASPVAEKMEKALKPLQIPVVYVVQDSLSDCPAAFRFLGKLFNRPSRAEALARHAEQTLEEIARVRAAIPAPEQVSVYYAEGADGLSTECHTSVHAQPIPLSGGLNVHRCTDRTTYGMQKISMEQVLQYDPQVIVAHEPMFFATAARDPRWKNIRAVQSGRVYRIPRTPFNWFDRPPSFMRLLGAKWMLHRLYPRYYAVDLTAETQRFYQLYLNVTLDAAAARKILKP
jgi:iron complex transport system substrate-binding protein